MSVGVQRDADVRMPHEHLQIFEVGAAGDHVRSIGVSQSMHVEGDRFQVRLDELVAVLQGLRRDQLSVRFSADEADRNQLLTGICFCQEFTAADSAADCMCLQTERCRLLYCLLLPVPEIYLLKKLYIRLITRRTIPANRTDKALVMSE